MFLETHVNSAGELDKWTMDDIEACLKNQGGPCCGQRGPGMTGGPHAYCTSIGGLSLFGRRTSPHLHSKPDGIMTPAPKKKRWSPLVRKVPCWGNRDDVSEIRTVLHPPALLH